MRGGSDRQRARAPGAAGFTMIEVLVTVAILATLTALVWASVSNMFASRDFLDERSERFQSIRLAMDRMSRELSSAYLAGPDYGGEVIPGEELAGLESAAEQEEDGGAGALGRLREPKQYGLIGREDALHFTSFAHRRTREGEPASFHAEIGYELRDVYDDDRGAQVTQLVRRVDTTLDDDIREGGIVQVMLPEVESVEIAYWDTGPMQIGNVEEMAEGRWVDSWDTTRREFAGRLPPRVRITIVVPMGGERTQTFTTQARIAATEYLEY